MDNSAVTIYQDINICAKTKLKLSATATVAGDRPGRVNHNAPKCRITICDTVKDKCSRDASLIKGKYKSVSTSFTSSKNKSMVRMEVTIACDNFKGNGGPMGMNYVYVDEIMLAEN